MKRRILNTFILFLAAQTCVWAADKTVAVLTRGSGAYLEAFSAFQAAYGRNVKYYSLNEGKPELDKNTKIVVTFGGKAADQSYPRGVSHVHCMAPGIFISDSRTETSIKVSLFPDFPVSLQLLKRIQPDLKRLAILWMVPETSPIVPGVKAEGARLGIQITTVRLKVPDDLPEALRNTIGTQDAVWLAPDPLIITHESLRILRDFSWGNKIPFYGSTNSMTREGAVASVGASFAEMGKAAAAAAKALSEQRESPKIVFPANAELSLSATAAEKCGIKFSKDMLEEAGYLYP